tara:strand:- start:3806 stop:4123 length:318 start_codon:yes stop_codon:yes gene_type:complete
MFKGRKNLNETKPKNLPNKDNLKKKPTKKELKQYGSNLDEKHPFRKLKEKKDIEGEDIFDKSSKKSISKATNKVKKKKPLKNDKKNIKAKQIIKIKNNKKPKIKS